MLFYFSSSLLGINGQLVSLKAHQYTNYIVFLRDVNYFFVKFLETSSKVTLECILDILLLNPKFSHYYIPYSKHYSFSLPRSLDI